LKNIQRSLLALFILLFSINLFSCQTQAYLWINHPTEEYSEKEFIPSGLIKNEYKNYYISLLESNNYIEITREEVRKITQDFNSKDDNNDKIFIVVRAVSPDKESHYRVTINEKNEIHVFYGRLGWAGKIKKDVIVIPVEILPGNIYISYSVIK
jgi:hypothetical protein